MTTHGRVEEKIQLAIAEKIGEVGLTVTEIANYCDVSPIQLRNIIQLEGGMSLMFAKKVCKGLGISMDECLEIKPVKAEKVKKEILVEKLSRKLEEVKAQMEVVRRGESRAREVS